jgi:hypothetical protein
MGNRYYLVQMLDAWTETFSVPGTRTTGNKAGKFAVVGPGWKGAVPAGMSEIQSPTNIVWLIGRIQTNGPADYANVRAMQRGFNVAPISSSSIALGEATSDLNGRITGLTPRERVAQQDANAFFSAFAELLKANPPHADDAAFVTRLKSLGITPGKPFDRTVLSPDAMVALDRAVKEAQPRFSRRDVIVRNGWQFATTIGRYGTDYLNRAAVARRGLGALPPEDAIYPSTSVDVDGRPLSGANKYVMHFEKSALPPVNAFWSLTLYDADGYFSPNAITATRSAIGTS